MNAPAPETVAFAEEELSGKLLQIVVNQLDGNRQPWNSYPKDDQEIKLNSMRLAVEEAVKGAVYVIAAGHRSYLKAGVESVTFKDGVKAVFTLLKTADAHDLADAEGNQVLIVITDAEKFLQGGEKIEAQPDQPSLPLTTKRKEPAPEPKAKPEEKPEPAPVPEVLRLKDKTFQIVIGKDKVHYPGSPESFKTALRAEEWLQKRLAKEEEALVVQALAAFSAAGTAEGKKHEDDRDFDAGMARAAKDFPAAFVEDKYTELSEAFTTAYDKALGE